MLPPQYICKIIDDNKEVILKMPYSHFCSNGTIWAKGDDVEIIGYPESAINLSHVACYLAQARKNCSSYCAYFKAVDDAKKYGNLLIPLMICNPVTPLMKNLGYGKHYRLYTKENLLPEKLKDTRYLREQ